jgi:hypothetical protein
MNEIHDSGLSSHIDRLAEEGFKINPPPFNKLAAWSRILLQLSNSGHSLGRLENFDSELRDLDSSFLQVALLHSFVLQYGKCYTSVGSGLVKLDANTVFKGEEALRATHDRIMNLPHNTFAHNDVGDLLRADILVRDNETHLQIKHTFTMAIPNNEFPRWRLVHDHVQHYTTARLNKRLDDLQIEIGKPIVFR